MVVDLRRSFDEMDTPLHQVTFVVVDVETTGGSPAMASLTEVAAARYRGGEMLATFRTFVRPDEPISPMITALTGIDDAMVADAPRIDEILPSLVEFIGGAVLVGHNLRFDLSFLDHALVATGRDCLANDTVDTLALSRRLVRDVVPDCKLATLARSLRLSHQPSHRALSDVLATGDLLHAMLERAGSFGILGLGELLDLPRLIGHPQSAKLPLTVRLPHRPGVYWLTDASGIVLFVEKATDLQEQVRSYFTGDRDRMVGRLLRQLHAIGHRECPDPLTAAVIEERLIRAWSPPFNRRGELRGRKRSSVADRSARSPLTPPRRRSGRRPRWSDVELDGDPHHLLAPLAERLTELSRERRYEEAAAVRDDAERLRRLLARRRQVEALRAAGRVVLRIDEKVTVELEDGLVIGCRESDRTGAPNAAPGVDPLATVDGDDRERITVAEWIDSYRRHIRVLWVQSDHGISMPSARIPMLTELCELGGQSVTAGRFGSAA